MSTSTFTRIKPRTDTYSNWEKVNSDAMPQGLFIMQGEICIVLADGGSAQAGLSNVTAIGGLRTQRLPNAGEVLGFKIGEAASTRWDLLPLHVAFPEINFPNKTGRILGTQSNGATHQYKHPGLALKAIFAPVYSGPGVGAILTTGLGALTGINGALIEVGQVLTDVQLSVSPQLGTYRIKQGGAYEITPGHLATLGLLETAQDPNTINSFSRVVDPAFVINATNGAYQGDGSYQRTFNATVTDARPSAEGAETTSTSGTLSVKAVYPTYFGRYAGTIPTTDPAALGTFVQTNCTPTIKTKQSYAPGAIPFRNLERAVFAYPAIYGALRDITDALGNSQLGVGGAFEHSPYTAVLTKSGRYANVPFLLYASETGYNADIALSFLF